MKDSPCHFCRTSFCNSHCVWLPVRPAKVRTGNNRTQCNFETLQTTWHSCFLSKKNNHNHTTETLIINFFYPRVAHWLSYQPNVILHLRVTTHWGVAKCSHMGQDVLDWCKEDNGQAQKKKARRGGGSREAGREAEGVVVLNKSVSTDKIDNTDMNRQLLSLSQLWDSTQLKPTWTSATLMRDSNQWQAGLPQSIFFYSTGGHAQVADAPRHNLLSSRTTR